MLFFRLNPVSSRKLHQTVILAIAAVLLGFPACATVGTFPVSDLSINGHAFKVEVATTTEELEQGLMYRTHLDADRGMLFTFQRPQKVMMWMKNTLIPLDMLFIDETGTIIYIKENAVPESLDTITTNHEVKAVLELAGGTSKTLGLKEGDKVRHATFAFKRPF